MGQRIVGVEFSPGELKLALLDAQLRRTSLVRVGTLPWLEGQTLEERQAQVADFLQGSVDAVVACAPMFQVGMRSMQFPFQDVRKLESAIAFELEGQLPLDSSGTLLSFSTLTRGRGSTEVLAAWSRQEPIAQVIAALEPLGLEPQVVIHPALALLPWLKLYTTPTAVLAWHQDRMDVLVGQDSQPYWARTLPMGGQWLVQAMAKHFDLTEGAALQALLQQQCWWPAEKRQQDKTLKQQSEQMEKLLAPLLGQLGLTFARLPVGHRPKQLVVIGPLGQVVALPMLLQEQLGVPTTCQSHQQVAAAFELEIGHGPDAGYLSALGLGMLRLSLSGREIPLNMRQGPLAYEGNFSRYRGTIMRAVVGVCLLGLLGLCSSVLQLWLLGKEDRMLTEGICQTSQKLVGQEICQAERALAMLQSQAGIGATILPMFSAARVLEMVSTWIPTEMDVIFEELDIRLEGVGGQSDRIQGKGEAASFETTEQLVAALKRDQCVEDAEVSRLRKGQNSTRVEFFLTVKIQCPHGIIPGTQLRPAEPNGSTSPSPSATEGGPPASAPGGTTGQGPDAGAPGAPPRPGALGDDVDPTSFPIPEPLPGLAPEPGGGTP